MPLVGNWQIKHNNTVDYLLSGVMLFCSIWMFVYGVFGFIQNASMSVLYLVFGGLGLLLSIKDFSFYKNFKATKNSWLVAHISKMVGALIASVTAFIIAGVGITSLIAWILPSVIGTFYIIYYKRVVLKR